MIHNDAELTCSSQDYSVITEPTLTSYGDVDTVTVTNMDLSGPSETMTYQQSTVNEYSYSESNLNKWYMGRLTCSTLTTEVPRASHGGSEDEYEYRTSAFGHDSVTGILNQKCVDPG